VSASNPKLGQEPAPPQSDRPVIGLSSTTLAAAKSASSPDGIDPRIESALSWCEQRGIRPLLLAAPFALDATTHSFVQACTEVQGLVRWPDRPEPSITDKDGVFLPDAYSWRLPDDCPPHILFIDGPGALTARMITAALRRRVRTVVFTTFGTWRRRPLLQLAIAKLARKLAAKCVDTGRGPCQSLVDYWYRRALAPVLAAAPLRFDTEPSTTLREGIVIACPTLVAGGAERQIVNTAIGLRAAGLGPLTVLVSRLHSPPGNAFFLDRLLAAGIEVRDVASPTRCLERWAEAQRLAENADGRRTLTLLRHLPQPLGQEILDLGMELARLNPSVVHSWLDYSNTRAGLAAACAGVPRIILSGRNVSPRHFSYIHEPFMRGAYRALLTRPGVILSNNSRGGASDYADWLGLDPKAIDVVYNGVDLADLQRSPDNERTAFRVQFGIDANAPLIGAMFRLSAEKRPLLWLDAVALIGRELPAAKFMLFGEGPLRPAMERRIAASGLNDRLQILPPTTEVARALSSFDLLLLTSQWEGTPNVAIEAQAVSTPVVLTGGGGAREAIAEGTTGIYVEEPDAQAIAQAAVLMLRAEIAMTDGHLANFVNERFAMNRMISRTREVYGL